MAKRKVVFIIAPSCFPTMPPLGPANLCALVKDLGHDAHILDLNVKLHNTCDEEKRRLWISAENQDFWLSPARMEEMFSSHHDFFSRHINDIIATNPFFVAFSTWFTNAHMSLVLAGKIREIDRDILIVFGGPEVTRMNFMAGLYSKDALSPVDLFVKGEGEPVIRELLGDGMDPRKPTFSDSIRYDPWKRLAEPLVREELDLLPVPDFTTLDLDEYTAKGLMPLSTSRGCINRCIFCDEAKLWGKFRSRSAEKVFRDVVETKKRHPGLAQIDFGDSLINGNIRELRHFSELMAEANPGVTWGGNAVIRPEMDLDLLRQMAAGGCTMLIYGLETASTGLYRHIGKFAAVKADPGRVIRDTFDAGIDSQINFMFGLPGETEEDALHNIEFLDNNIGKLTKVVPSFAFCNICPGTPAYENPEAYGIKANPNPCFWESTDGSNTYPVRMARFERFVRFVHENRIPTNYPYPEFLHRERWLASYHTYMNDLETAESYIRLAMEKEPDDSSLREQLQGIQQQILVNRAMESLKGWDKNGDVTSAELVSLGEELFCQGKTDEAMLVFCKLLAREPDNCNVLNNLGVIYLSRGETQKARILFERCLHIDPSHIEAINNMDWLDGRKRMSA